MKEKGMSSEAPPDTQGGRRPEWESNRLHILQGFRLPYFFQSRYYLNRSKPIQTTSIPATSIALASWRHVVVLPPLS